MTKKKNFRIIENSPPEYLEKYDEFIELYYDSTIRKKDIPKILGWSTGQYKKARAKAVEDGLIEKPKTGIKAENPKYYYYDKKMNRYIVSRDTKRIHVYRAFKTKKEAKELVAYLNEYGWTKENAYNFKNSKRRVI